MLSNTAGALDTFAPHHVLCTHTVCRAKSLCNPVNYRTAAITAIHPTHAKRERIIMSSYPRMCGVLSFWLQPSRWHPQQPLCVLVHQ